jgi:hypothetical protein
VRVRGIGLAAPGEDPENRVLQLDADLDETRAADRVDPKGPADALADRLAELLVDDIEKGLRRRRRQGLERRDRHRHAERPGGEFLDLGMLRILRVVLQNIDNSCDLTNDGFGHAPRHKLVVPLHERRRRSRIAE